PSFSAMPQSPNLSQENEKLKDEIAALKQKLDKQSNPQFRQNTPRPSDPRKNIQCNYCKNIGHVIAECRKRQFNERRGNSRGTGYQNSYRQSNMYPYQQPFQNPEYYPTLP